MGLTHKALLVGFAISCTAIICTTPFHYQRPGVLPVIFGGGNDDSKTPPGVEIHASARAYAILSDNELALTTTESSRTEKPLDEKPDMAEAPRMLTLADG